MECQPRIKYGVTFFRGKLLMLGFTLAPRTL